MGAAGTDDAEAEAARLDAADPVPSLREEFVVPPGQAYLAGNSLGLMPSAAAAGLTAALDDWGRLGVEAWFDADEPWIDQAARLRPALGRLVGAPAEDVVAMSSLTANLHLLLASFYRPEGARTRILIEADAFPSDAHAVAGQVAWHGLDPGAEVVRAPAEDLLGGLAAEGDRVAVVLLGAVSYLSGERRDMAALTAAAHDVGALCGWDLAHAIGNVPVDLLASDADFAVWCHYKYLNAGPGAPGGAFVHPRHAGRSRLGGWWGVDQAERFAMALDHAPAPGAEGWAVSTPSVLGLVPLQVSLEQFDRVGLDGLRQRSIRLTGYLEGLLSGVEVLTPGDPERRGAQLSVRVPDAAAVTRRLRHEHGVIVDSRPPDVVRLAPAPLYSTYDDCRRAAAALQELMRA